MDLKHVSAVALAISVAIGCNSENDSNAQSDRTAPTISQAEGRDGIRPAKDEVLSTTYDHMHVRFQVNDPSGISEALVDVHHVFDGHSHGKTQGTFEPLAYRKVYEANGANSLNIDSNFDDIYFDGNESVIAGKVLAGPYHFGIDAIDIHGNQTSNAANNNYVATFFIERPYAPAISVINAANDELEGYKNQPLQVLGTIEKTTDALASDLSFIWVRLGEEHDDHSHNKTNDEYFYETKWGTSNWNHGTGIALPDVTSIDLSTLLSGTEAIVLPNEDTHMELIIWAEDIEGNVIQKKYEVHVH